MCILQPNAIKQITPWDKYHVIPVKWHYYYLPYLLPNLYMLVYGLFCLWNIYEGAELPSVYFITNTKHNV